MWEGVVTHLSYVGRSGHTCVSYVGRSGHTCKLCGKEWPHILVMWEGVAIHVSYVGRSGHTCKLCGKEWSYM